jgi:hypothetical protein
LRSACQLPNAGRKDQGRRTRRVPSVPADDFRGSACQPGSMAGPCPLPVHCPDRPAALELRARGHRRHGSRGPAHRSAPPVPLAGAVLPVRPVPGQDVQHALARLRPPPPAAKRLLLRPLGHDRIRGADRQQAHCQQRGVCTQQDHYALGPGCSGRRSAGRLALRRALPGQQQRQESEEDAQGWAG